MSYMKCPKCGGRLVYWGATGALLKCSQCHFGWGNEELWQELIRTRKALEDAKKWLMKIGYLDMAEHGLGSEPMMTDWCKTVALHGLKEIETALTKGGDNE